MAAMVLAFCFFPHLKIRSFATAVGSSIYSLGRLNHVAIAVPDLAKSVAFYRDILGAQVSEVLVFAQLNFLFLASSRSWCFDCICSPWKHKD
jgi:hypothetical protein